MEICLMKIFRSNRWLQAVREIDCCILCGRYGVQAAHRNEGKGIGLKVDDSLTAALCVTNGAIVIHTQRLKSDPGGNLLS
ncbi:hypothetical protein CDK59_17845 [Salmonella enterica subsp. enterica serovar Kentucky]|nr:hypothetical protein [Salmonella enterica subsp. enterica serovar Kentucky]